MDKYFLRFYPEARFGDFSDVDGTIRFYSRVRALLKPDFTVLDIGCGRASDPEALTSFEKMIRIYKGQAKYVVGIDPDPIGETNPTLDEFRLINGPKWPIDDCSIDLAVSDWTMEHVEDPDAFLRECHRVLRPGGFFCMRTANRLGYVVALSSLIPNQLHTKVLSKVQPSRDNQDVFPTFYRCNTVGKLSHALKGLGFDACVYGHNPEPSYLGFSYPSYALGVLYQRIIPRAWGTTLFVYARKK